MLSCMHAHAGTKWTDNQGTCMLAFVTETYAFVSGCAHRRQRAVTVTVTVYRFGFDFTRTGTDAEAPTPGHRPTTAGTRQRMEALPCYKAFHMTSRAQPGFAMLKARAHRNQRD